jgi:hypothetical protein
MYDIRAKTRMYIGRQEDRKERGAKSDGRRRKEADSSRCLRM